MDGVEDFDPACFGLREVRSAVVGGLVLIDLGGDAGPPEDHVGELLPKLEHYSVAELRRGGLLTYEVKANWKGIAENYNECLHCPGVHPELNALSDYMSGESAYGAGAWCGGSMTLVDGAETMGTGNGHAGNRPPIATLVESDLRGRPLLRAVPERAGVAASRLRDAAHPLAQGSGPDRRHLRVLLRARGDRGARLRPRRRRRLLEPGQRRGLARLRTEPEGNRLARLLGRALLGRGT